MGATAVIGGGVDLNGVALTGGSFDTTSPAAPSTIDSSSTIDGTVQMTGAVSILDARILPTGEVQVQSGGTLSISAGALDLDGRLRSEAGGAIHLTTPGAYDWSGGNLSLADDASHSVDPDATVILTTPLEFDNLSVESNSTGFVRAVFGVEPVIEAGEELSVAGTTTLNRTLVVDGGKLTTGFLNNYQNLDLRTGEFHLTSDDFIVDAGGAGPVFTVATSATLRVDELVDVVAGNRLIVSGGALHVEGVSGSSLTNGGDLDIIDAGALFVAPAANNADLNAIDSTLTFTGGLTNNGQLNLINTTVNGPVNNGAGAALSGVNTFNGDVSGEGNFSGDGTAVFQAGLAPGASPATVSFGGNVEFAASATLQIELGGTVPGSEFDVVDVTGSASLDGVLDVSLINAFTPAPGQSFEIMTFASRLGQFAQHDGTGLLSDVFLLPIYADTSLLLYSAIPGDVNLDGIVDGLDVNVISANFMTGAEYSSGDANGDGFVNGDDLTLVSDHFGESAPPPPLSGGLNTVPEPSAGLLVALAVLALMFVRWPSRGLLVPCT